MVRPPLHVEPAHLLEETFLLSSCNTWCLHHSPGTLIIFVMDRPYSDLSWLSLHGVHTLVWSPLPECEQNLWLASNPRNVAKGMGWHFTDCLIRMGRLLVHTLALEILFAELMMWVTLRPAGSLQELRAAFSQQEAEALSLAAARKLILPTA